MIANPSPGLPPFALTIYGTPITKKNSSRIIHAGGRPRIIPSAAHQRWHRVALAQVQEQVLSHRQLPICQPVNVAATFYRERAVGDASNYYAALADLLEHAGVVENDRLITQWDNSRLAKDAKNPRIELVVTPL